MNDRIEKLEAEVSKLKWQLCRVADGMVREHEAEGRFVVLRDISEPQLDAIWNAFEAQENVMKCKEALEAEVSWEPFEAEIRAAIPHVEDLHIYEVVQAMDDSGRWKDVCAAWRESH
jgi:hypothetical protein